VKNGLGFDIGFSFNGWLNGFGFNGYFGYNGLALMTAYNLL
jgi:hypothetical protein